MEPVTRAVVEADLTELMSSAWECAEDLEAEIEAKYPSRNEQPVQERRYHRDMEPVLRFRAAYNKLEY